MSPKTYIVAGRMPWNRRAFDDVISRYEGQWHFVSTRDELTRERLVALDPRYVFFLHWSWKVPPEIVSEFECVNFHMTDLPFGRGGSPLQNLLVRGIEHSHLSAIKMTDEFDAGPVYLKRELCLAGTAEATYLRSTRVAAEMIREIIDREPQPVPQEGNVTLFTRRKPEESLLTGVADLDALHNFIRMLDAEGYPHAFLEYGGFRFEFTRAARYDGCVRADVRITPSEPGWQP